MKSIAKHLKQMVEFLKAKGYYIEYWEKHGKGAYYMPGKLIMVTGITVGRILPLRELTEWRNGGRVGERPKPIMEVSAYCSVGDQFYRKKGNVIVTARIIKRLGLTHEFKKGREAYGV